MYQQSHHSCSFPSNRKRFPSDAENRARGQFEKTTDRERFLLLWIRIRLLWASFRSPHGLKEPGICSTECRTGMKWKAWSCSFLSGGIIWPWRPGGPVVDPGPAQTSPLAAAGYNWASTFRFSICMFSTNSSSVNHLNAKYKDKPSKLCSCFSSI